MSTIYAKMDSSLNILHVMLVISETSMPYNEFCLAAPDSQQITICTFFKSNVSTPPHIDVVEGDNTPFGFIKAVKGILSDCKFDIIHIHAPQLGILYLVARLFLRSPIPVIYTVHNCFYNYKLRNKIFLLPLFFFFTRIITCSQASYDSFPKIYKLLAGKKMKVISNGVDLDRIDQINNRHEPTYSTKEKSNIVVIGQLIQRKNPNAVLLAFKYANDPNSTLIFIGEGDQKEQILEDRQTHDLSKRVQITGLLPRIKVYQVLRKASLFLSPSYGEGLPIAVLEAMACRCPVILSDIQPHREIATGTDFIPLVEPNNIEGFARQIKKYQKMDPNERKKIGAKCRKLVEERFSLVDMLSNYEQEYLEICNDRSDP
jgi:glycosyltransferase involved in cell wall biosynthesis